MSYISNNLDNIFYNVHCQIKSVKGLGESLEKKYKTKDVCSNKFVVGAIMTSNGGIKVGDKLSSITVIVDA